MGGKGGTQGPLNALPSQARDLAPATTTAVIYTTTKHPKRGYSYRLKCAEIARCAPVF